MKVIIQSETTTRRGEDVIENRLVTELEFEETPILVKDQSPFSFPFIESLTISHSNFHKELTTKN